MKPGEAGVKFVPINKMAPRSFITNVTAGEKLRVSRPHGSEPSSTRSVYFSRALSDRGLSGWGAAAALAGLPALSS